MKKFLCAASFAMIVAMAIPAAQAAGSLGAKVPHLTSSGYNPNNQPPFTLQQLLRKGACSGSIADATRDCVL